MKEILGKIGEGLLRGASVAALGGALLAGAAQADTQTTQNGQATEVVPGERYTPTIWIDPDGCEHWTMDDGAEGFMDARRRRDGSAVCHRSEICGVVPTDQLFATDRASISAAGRQALENFFRTAQANGTYSFLIYGHTDSRASDEYNMRLSQRRANAVADVAWGIGAKVTDVRGFGERSPRATNDTPEGGMAQNRRVEIYCLKDVR